MGDSAVNAGIDLHDVQGNVVKGYGRYGFPVARFIFYRVNIEGAGRDFVTRLLPMITTSAPWTRFDLGQGIDKPKVTTNVAFTYEGLKQLGVPEQSLHSFPEEFSMGMRARTSILGDDGRSAPEHWDPIWSSVSSGQVAHVVVQINAETTADLEQRYDEITALLTAVNAAT